MKSIKVKVYWAEKNYCCGWSDDSVGSIVCTHKTVEGVKQAFEESLDFHMEGMAADGDRVPEWYVNKEFNIDYEEGRTCDLPNTLNIDKLQNCPKITRL